MDKTVKKQNIFVKTGNFFKAKAANIKAFFKRAGRETYASMVLMGSGQMINGQYVKGIIYLLLEAAFIAYFATVGVADFIGFFTLGTVKGDAWAGIEGDDSVIMLLRGIVAWIAVIVLAVLYVSNLKDANKYAEIKGIKNLPTFKDDLTTLLNKNFYKVALALPLIGVAIFNILPIVFMILIAFTNYGTVVPPELVDWSGEFPV